MILTVLGARPQFIKAAPVSTELKRRGIPERIVHTGQHYDRNMSDIFFEELGIDEPAYFLGVGSASHGAQTGAMLAAVEPILQLERPRAVVVYGDTNSTLAGALAAAKLQIPVIHVEAGLRSFNRAMPEEVNRVLTDHISDMLLAPTPVAMSHLANEGLAAKAHLVGDVMFDIAKMALPRIAAATPPYGLPRGDYILLTIHRAENTDDPARLTNIVAAMRDVAQETPVIFPLHPRTRSSLAAIGIGADDLSPIRVVEPLGFLDMTWLQRDAGLIVTDSGGVQKEAYFHGVPCVTLRQETEWVELVEAGWNYLADPTDREAIVTGIRGARGRERDAATGLYGDGEARRKIVDLIQDSFCA